MQVDSSRPVCEAVAGGELDAAIVGGDIPEELADTLTAVPYAEARPPRCFVHNGSQASVRQWMSDE